MQINKHGSFYIRSGWPTKIIDAVYTNPFIFTPNNEMNAVDEIGVGRVMVKAMRYWSSAIGLTNEEKTTQGVKHVLSDVGETISKKDPYFQKAGTLWLLHRNLARNKKDATAWYWAFNEMKLAAINKSDFVNDFYSFTQQQGENFNKKSIDKEFDCFKNTYVSDKSFDIDKIIEENTIPFFAPLGLIKNNGNGNYELRKVTAKEIPLEVALFCIISDNEEYLTKNKQIDIEVLANGINQIGKYMNLTYTSLLDILQKLHNSGKIIMENNFGNRYIQISDNDKHKLLEEYYR